MQQRYLICVKSALVCDQPVKKREAKAQIKEQQTDELEAPVRLNLLRFLGEERRRAVLQMAKSKLHNSTDELPSKLFLAMADLDREGCPKQAASKEKIKTVGFTSQDILNFRPQLGTDNQVNEAFAALH